MLLLCEQIKALKLENYVIVSPDAGYAKQAREYSKYLCVPTVICDKTRTDHNECASILEIIGDVNGKNAIIVDDFLISGGTLIDLAHKLKEHGAKNIIACISHLLINEKGAKRLNESCIDMLISTNSIHNPTVNLSDKIKIVTAAPLFAEAILCIHNNMSISPLFNALPEKLIQLSE